MDVRPEVEGTAGHVGVAHERSDGLNPWSARSEAAHNLPSS